MPSLLENPLTMFLALFALYSPLAAVSSYFPIMTRLNPKAQRRLAIGLFTYVSIFVLTALWIGEPLLELLGISTDALIVTGGIALIFAGIPLMKGTEEPPPKEGSEGTPDAAGDWRSVLLMPVTFPLTVGGTTFAILVSYRAQSKSMTEVIALSVAALLYALVTGITVYASGHLERRVSTRGRVVLERIAGILLTAIAVSLLGSGAPRMVATTLANMRNM